jgi:hypothetical protein
MPVRRRKDRRAADGEAWVEIFEYGFDMLHSAYAAGILVNERLEPDVEEARAAWRKYGRAFLERHDGAECWALDTFGRP